MTRNLLGIGLLVVLSGVGNASAQSYPARPVRVIVTQTPASSVDTITRIVFARMSETVGQQFVVDNRGGAGGTIGAQIGARATPDGYTLISGAASSLINSKFTYRTLTFDALKDFEPISLIVNAESALVVNPNLPAKSVKEFIAFTKAQPGKLNMASAGIGSSSHLAGIMFASLAGIDIVHVPYKGGGMSSTSVITGETHWCISPLAALAGHIRSGRLRSLGISSRVRSPLMPDLPTIAEAGVPSYEYTSWNGVLAPKGTPRQIIMKIHAAIQKVLAEPEVARLYAIQGLVPMGNASPEEFARFFREDFNRVAKVIKLAGIEPE